MVSVCSLVYFSRYLAYYVPVSASHDCVFVPLNHQLIVFHCQLRVYGRLTLSVAGLTMWN